MEQLNQLTTIIQENKRFMRFEQGDLVRFLDAEILATKTARCLVGLASGKTTLTSFAGKIGKEILIGFETEEMTEKSVKKNRVLCGLSIVRALIEEKIVKISQDFKTKQWFIEAKNNDFIDAFVYGFPVDKIKSHKFPSLSPPSERRSFFDVEGGPLVTNLDRRNLHAFKYDQIPLVYSQINKLQGITYRINQDVLNAFYEVQDRPLFTFSNKMLDAEAKRGLKRDKNMTLSTAKQIGDNDFWFYWNLDRRGRFYCASTYLTIQGSKLSKSLIYLKDKKKLGKEGLFWLYVHTANCAGQDKLPINDRYEWTENHLDEVLSCGANPKAAYEMWSQMDDPYGFLSASIEIYKAHQGVPEEFESGLMVGFDATTSGLQIMSMMSRCEITGKLCNLTDSNEVGDIYKYIADQIWPSLSKYWRDKHDKRRKLVKRSVMTFFYSCGAKKMSEAIMSDFKATIKGLTNKRALELGQAVYDGCKEHLPGASAIMELFVEVGKTAIGNDDLRLNGLSNNFPFIQTYKIPETATVDFRHNGNKLRLRYIASEGKMTDIRKIITGSSPNIVHHLDSQIVSELIRVSDYTMVPVHDCFSAVPSDAGKMYEDVRKCFYRLFGELDILQELCDKFDVNNTIKYGSLDTTQVLDNEYCFS